MLQAMGLGAGVLNDMDPFSEVWTRPSSSMRRCFLHRKELDCPGTILFRYPDCEISGRTVFQLSSPKSSGNPAVPGIGFRLDANERWPYPNPMGLAGEILYSLKAKAWPFGNVST